jgi:hypothetical protein
MKKRNPMNFEEEGGIMAWEVRRVVNEEGCTTLGPYQTEHMAAWRAEQDAVKLRRLGYDLVWYEIVEVTDGVPDRACEEIQH